MVHDRAILTVADQQKSCMFYGTAPFSTILNNLYSRFQRHALIAEYLRNCTRYRHSLNIILLLKGVISNDLE